MASIGTKITRYISVPFEGCDRCRYLSPETETDEDPADEADEEADNEEEEDDG